MADYNSTHTGEEIDAAVDNAKTAADLKTAYESNADTNAFTDAEKNKLSGIETGAEVNAVDSVFGRTGAVTAQIGDYTKSDVGLGNVDNTSDVNKPISTATQIALDAKQGSLTLTTTGTSGASTLIGDTLNIPNYAVGGGAVDSVNGETGAVILTTGDITEDTDANYVTDAQLAVIEYTSGTNTGDQDLSGLVPYTGATQNVDLGEFQIDAGQVTFDQTPIQTAGVGVLRWNDTDGTLDLGLKGGNVTLQVGQEEVIRIVNKTDADLLESDFRAVRIRTVAEGGAQGQRLAVVLAQANSDINSATTIGLVTENITNNQEGFVTTVGNVNGINTTGAKSFTGTEDWQDGDVLYLDPDHAGYLTNIKPITPAHLIVIGYVVYSHVQGKIYVKVDNGYELEELHDVLITDITHREILQWNGIDSYWQNVTLAEAGIQPAGSYATAAQGALADSATQPSDNVSTLINDSNYLPSNPIGVTGADIVTNIMSLTQAEYDAIVTPSASTLYVING
jgi:hypothetical protein